VWRGEIRCKTVGEENKKHKNKNTETEGETRWRKLKCRRPKVVWEEGEGERRMQKIW
jgi:hypothetical protein